MIKWSQGEHLVCDEFGWLQWKAEDHNHYSAQFISSVLALSPLDTDCKKFLLKLISDESCIRFQVERVSLGDDYPIKRLYNGLYVKLGVKVWSSACGLRHKKLLILRYWWGIIMKCFFNFLVQKELFNTLYPLKKKPVIQYSIRCSAFCVFISSFKEVPLIFWTYRCEGRYRTELLFDNFHTMADVWKHHRATFNGLVMLL